MQAAVNRRNDVQMDKDADQRTFFADFRPAKFIVFIVRLKAELLGKLQRCMQRMNDLRSHRDAVFGGIGRQARDRDERGELLEYFDLVVFNQVFDAGLFCVFQIFHNSPPNVILFVFRGEVFD